MNENAPAKLRTVPSGRRTLATGSVLRIPKDDSLLRSFVQITNRSTGSTEWLSLQRDDGQLASDTKKEFDTCYEKSKTIYQTHDAVVIANDSGATITLTWVEYFTDQPEAAPLIRNRQRLYEQISVGPPVQSTSAAPAAAGGIVGRTPYGPQNPNPRRR